MHHTWSETKILNCLSKNQLSKMIFQNNWFYNLSRKRVWYSMSMTCTLLETLIHTLHNLIQQIWFEIEIVRYWAFSFFSRIVSKGLTEICSFFSAIFYFDWIWFLTSFLVGIMCHTFGAFVPGTVSVTCLSAKRKTGLLKVHSC